MKKRKKKKGREKETKGRDNQYSQCFCEGVAGRYHIWPKLPGRFWPSLLAEFGQFLLTEFGQTAFGQFCFWWGPGRVGARRGRGPNPEKVGARKVGGPKFRAFFALSHRKFHSFFSLWEFSRGILVVFEAPGRSNVRVWALWLSCGTPAAPPERRGSGGEAQKS